MAAPDKDTSALFLSGSVILIAALGGYLWYQAPLKSARPANPGLERHEATVTTRALARLWQDPLAAVDEHRKSPRPGTAHAEQKSWTALADQIAAKLNGRAPLANMAVLVVMTDGSSYVEGTEQRIRDRYAIGSALSVACYVPEDGDHVGYVMTDNDPPIAVPFEWYGPRALRDCAPNERTLTLHDHVLILWVSDELIPETGPLKKLAEMIHAVDTLVRARIAASNPGAPQFTGIAYNLIGPSSSSLFREMVREAGVAGPAIQWPIRRAAERAGSLAVFSPWATVSSDLLAENISGLYGEATQEGSTWISEQLGRANVALSYRVPSDFELSRALVQELHLRGVHAGSQIALLAEWDSYYGRTLPLEFSAAACMDTHQGEPGHRCHSHKGALEALAIPAKQRDELPWIHQYSYLRGLDGEIPGGESGGGRGGRGKPGKGGDRNVDDLERPEGESQLDYVRRLADRLEADSEDRDFRAIGILGSDVYDKLLILQALRKRFPHTIFFTTDLDARLLHPSQYDWTHNLIVASHYGLQVHPALQREIPPFRSSYQSGTFLGALQAIGHLQQTRPGSLYSILGDDRVTFAPATAPLVFEVGRTGAHRLPTAPDETRGAATGVAREEEHLNSPDSTASQRAMERRVQLRFLLIILAVVCVLYLAIPVLRSIPDEMLSPDISSFIMRTAVALAIALGLVLVLFNWVSKLPGGEPFFWAEGISLWPSVLIRLMVAALSFGFLRFAQSQLTANETNLTDQYHLQRTTTHASTVAGWRWLLSPMAWSIDFRANAQQIADLWSEHGQFERTAWQRVVPQTVMLGILGVILLYVFGIPHAPARGSAALVIHIMSWMLSSVLMGLLMFFVVDAIRVCTGFIHQFALESTQWSPSIVQPLSDRRKVPHELISEWLDIRFIADRTKVVAALIHFPILALFLMILARHRIFDDWAYPPGLLIIYGVSAAYILICAILLSVAAEKARRSAVTRLRTHLYDLRGRAQEAGQGERIAQQIAQIDLMLQDIHGMQQGAFAHWTQHPVFQALLLPSGGFSVLALLDYFLTQ